MGEMGAELSSGVCSAMPCCAVGSTDAMLLPPALRLGVCREVRGKAISPPVLGKARGSTERLQGMC